VWGKVLSPLLSFYMTRGKLKGEKDVVKPMGKGAKEEEKPCH
jgi:hypothetical protein